LVHQQSGEFVEIQSLVAIQVVFFDYVTRVFQRNLGAFTELLVAAAGSSFFLFLNFIFVEIV